MDMKEALAVLHAAIPRPVDRQWTIWPVRFSGGTFHEEPELINKPLRPIAVSDEAGKTPARVAFLASCAAC
jgi:hypothetical protein